MNESHRFTWAEIEQIFNNIEGKTLGAIDTNHVFLRTLANPKITGIAGDVIEQSVFGYPADRDQRPDLNIEGEYVELKTTGLKYIKQNNSLIMVAKEPASITAVSFDRIIDENFTESAFWHKAERILFVFYLYNSKKTVLASDYADFVVTGCYYHTFANDDVMIIRNDWLAVKEFIKEIKTTYESEEERKEHYPKLSSIINKQLVYLDTAPKYPHQPRFRLRRRVVNIIVEERFYKNYQKLPDRYLGYNDVEKKCAEITRKYKGLSIAEILQLETDKGNDQVADICKKYAEMAVIKMFGAEEGFRISDIGLFKSFGYIGHTVSLTINNKRTEDIKLSRVDFNELTELYYTDDDLNEVRLKEFEDSDLYSYLHDNKMLCIIFQETEKATRDHKVHLSKNKFIGIKIIDLSDDEIMSAARNIWLTARDTILSGKLKNIPELDKKGNVIINKKTKTVREAPNLPKASESILFFRGTGSDSTNKPEEVSGVKMYYQNYWIKGKYIVDKLNI